MNKNFKYFFEEFGTPKDKVTPSLEQLNQFNDILPDALLDFWRDSGWSAYAEGLFWSTDPSPFNPALEAWLEGANISMDDTYNVIARSAFGDLFVWGTKSGASVIIHPLSSSVTTKNANINVQKGNPEAALTAFFVAKSKDTLDFEDLNEKPLFKRALKKLGSLRSDEMYAFEPALCLGGLPKLENLVKVKIVEHLVLLSQLDTIEHHHIDL